MSITFMVSSACGDSTPVVEDACVDAGGEAELRAEESRGSVGAAVAVFARTDEEWILCSGVLVGPRTVLTARHCVHGRDDWAINVHFTADLLSGGRTIVVGSRREHPTRDLAALDLDDDAPIDTAIMRWSGRALGSQHTQGLSIAGYGGPNGDVTKCLRVIVRVQDLSVDPFRTDATRYAVLLEGRAWPGDSGGPLVFDQAGDPILVGIHSGVTSGDVSNGSLAFVERLAQDDPWVLQMMESAPTEIP